MENSPRSTTASLGKLNLRDLLDRPPDPASEERARISAEAQQQEFRDKLRKNERRGFTSLSEKDWQVTFESLEVIPQNSEQIGRLKKWNPSMTKGVVLYGSVGTGKSTLCKAIINQFATKTYRCLFISVADAMQRLKDAIDKEGTTVGHETEKLIEPNLLILDDLGADKSTEWATERIFVIFEKRAAQDKHTFFTSNLTAKEISAVYKERIASRMMEFCSWVQFQGDDFRKKNFVNEI